MDWYLNAIRQKYMTFEGRARRAEFWWFTLISTIMTFTFVCADFLFGITEMTAGMAGLATVYGLAVLLPSAAVNVRRLQDTGRSFWYMFVSLIPVIGGLVLLYWMVQDSQPGTNPWGPSPKGVEGATREMAQAA
jgi:uncharacterized membrane protein YhaH (DUF805 family)